MKFAITLNFGNVTAGQAAALTIEVKEAIKGLEEAYHIKITPDISAEGEELNID